ncbi:MAG: hypothetical protein JSS79_12965 [Bacteroidetes bacterium]|nr:hypothetical protein [Bacteroidota bacterium]
MNLFSRFKNYLKRVIRLLIHRIKLEILLPLGYYDQKLLDKKISINWDERIKDVVGCPDNSKIKRDGNAGEIRKGAQFMHNGIRITLGGYYGAEIAQMLVKNKGVHEPQEEYAFGLVLKDIKKGATIIELGSYWAFYSMWFLRTINGAKAYLIEPDVFNMAYGKNNFKLNRLKGDFTTAFVGANTCFNENGEKVVSVADFIRQKKIDFVDILHSDIQGSELVMLQSINKILAEKRIGYLFVSTHSNELHYDCLSLLEESGYQLVCHADLDNSFSVDGLIVAKSPMYPGIEKIEISDKK